MSIYLGETEILAGALYLGETAVSEVYLGEAKIWPPAIPLALFETFELPLTNGNTYTNRFDYTEIFVEATFTAPSSAEYTIRGYHDGGTSWKVRFPPVEEGAWTYTYTWSDATPGGSGGFTVGPKAIADLHGPVQNDPINTRYLRHWDGSAHFLVASSWTFGIFLGPTTKGGQTNAGIDGLYGHVNDAGLDAELDELVTRGLNSVWITLSEFPIENDGLTWDLTWAARIDRYVQEALARGLYVVIQVFDTWSRNAGGGFWFEFTTNNETGHPFNAWAATSGPRALAINFINYTVARWGGYSNVYWELCNEFDHPASHSGTEIANFKSEAINQYIPTFKARDPFARPISCSERVDSQDITNLDIIGVHQAADEADGLPLPSASLRWHSSEWVRDGLAGGDLWQDSVIRTASNRVRFRLANWRLFAWGGCGSFEASSRVFGNYTSAVQNVMGDSGRLRSFIDTLAGLGSGVDINDSVPIDGSIITAGAGTASGWTRRRMRRRDADWYVVYVEASGSQGAGNFTLEIPHGFDYDAVTYNPSSGAYSSVTAIAGGAPTVPYPAFSDDIVLRVKRSSTTYSPNAVVGDGTNDWFSRTTAFTGAAASKSFTASFTLKLTTVPADGAIFAVSNTSHQARLIVGVYDIGGGVGRLYIFGRNSAGATIVDFEATTALTTGVQYAVALSFDLTNASNRQIVINGTVATLSANTYTDATLPLNDPRVSIFASNVLGSNKISGEISDLWVDYGRYVNLSQIANERKFFDASNNIEFLGTTGARPFGVAPTAYFRGATATWNRNWAGKGNMTLNGTFDTSGSPPGGAAAP